MRRIKLNNDGGEINQALKDAGLSPGIVYEYLGRVVVFKEVIRFNRENLPNAEYVHKEMIVSQVSILKDLLDEDLEIELLEICQLTSQELKLYSEKIKKSLADIGLEHSLIFEFLLYQRELSKDMVPFEEDELSPLEYRKYEVMAYQIGQLIKLLS